MCEVLKEIYRKIYNESFVYDSLEHRIKLQKAVYILENMGVRIGDYSFSWNKYGPYSLALDSDAQRCNSRNEEEIIFSDMAEAGFSRIKEYIREKLEYTCANWMECIASLHYLKYVLRCKDENLLDELEDRKNYLSDRQANEKALVIMKGIKVSF